MGERGLGRAGTGEAERRGVGTSGLHQVEPKLARKWGALSRHTMTGREV